MISAIKAYFDRYIVAPRAEPEESLSKRLQLATAALFVEMTRMDHEIKDAEKARVGQLLQRKFSLDAAACERLLALAEEEARSAVDYYQFTALIHEHFDYPSKLRIVQYLWEIAYADGQLDKYEEHFVRRLADLLYIRHQDFIAAKHRVLETSGD